VIRRILRVRGTVQGVGFRPFVCRTARELGLAGRVWNDADGVVIDAEGESASMDALRARITDAPPPQAHVETVEADAAPPTGCRGFAIDSSDAAAPSSARVAPDLATCTACLRELFDPGDRRFGYPFVNCTDCGPRYTIAREVPYDRARTTMAAFAMCAACRTEYDDPESRRFHAQPNACPRCGPRVWLEPTGATGAAAIAALAAAIGDGRIAALKGLGGFHLACDARSSAAVALLRARKRRPARPFAVMFPDLASLEAAVLLDDAARAALVSARRPILLAPCRPPARVAPEVAPGLRELGVFLPATPLHALVLRACAAPLVMTSGNLSDEPIAADNDDARRRLAPLADVLLLHDRAIHMRADDSVVRVLRGRPRVLRRARGHVPESIDLGFDGPPLLAVGGDLKSALCLTSGRAAVLGQHVGDLESLEAEELFLEIRAHLERLFGVTPRLVAHDLHPGYRSTAIARRTGLPAVGVQHHHAHVASCLADNGRRGPVIGVAWDGTGYGPDGTVWGGEILAADLGGFERVAHLRPVALPGGDAAVREPWRMALAHLLAAGLPTARVAHPARATVEAMIRGSVNTVPTSSAGRLFDALASLAGVRDAVTYEGQAAIELEALADPGEDAPYPVAIADGPPLQVDAAPLVRAVVADVDAGVGRGRIAARVYASLAQAIAGACERVRERTRLEAVALSGGCFQSALLTARTADALERRGFEVLLHARVPANDGGLALGQAAVAAYRLREER
jgi:hydrogenase maturation protein HypF